jgi:hypothetical protein
MGYLTLNGGIPDFNKAVISFWFRVPHESVDAARAAYKGDNSPFDGMIPLMVMGKPGTGTTPAQSAPERVPTYQVNGWITNGTSQVNDISVVGACPQYGPYSFLAQGKYDLNLDIHFIPATDYEYTTLYNAVPTGPAPPTVPTCVAVNCANGASNLYVNFETAKAPQVSGLAFNQTVTMGPMHAIPGSERFAFDQGTKISQWCTPPFGLMIEHIGPETVVSNTIHAIYYPTSYDTGDPVYGYTDISDLSAGATGSIHSDLITVTPDMWHHVLISLDLKTVQTHGRGQFDDFTKLSDYVDSAADLFVALDDVNFTGGDLSGNAVGGDDPNAVLTDGAMAVAGTPAGGTGAVPAYMLGTPMIPAGGQAVGLPATAVYVDNIYRVEMAEFLLWGGVMLDTGVQDNRRLFIAPDKKGVLRPVNPSPTIVPISKFAVGDPAAWEPGADTPAFFPPLATQVPGFTASKNKLLGTADVDFTKLSLNWLAGHNLGTAKGKVATKGKIRAYFPDPSIRGS